MTKMNARFCRVAVLSMEIDLIGPNKSESGTLASAQAAYKFDAATVSGLPARNIGSAAMSGRVAAVDAIDQTAASPPSSSCQWRVWKSWERGTTYKSVFDRESVQSIGAVAIDPSNPKTVWWERRGLEPATGLGWRRGL